MSLAMSINVSCSLIFKTHIKVLLIFQVFKHLSKCPKYSRKHPESVVDLSAIQYLQLISKHVSHTFIHTDFLFFKKRKKKQTRINTRIIFFRQAFWDKNANIQFVQIACRIPSATVVVADTLPLRSLSTSVDCLGFSLFSRAAVPSEVFFFSLHK